MLKMETSTPMMTPTPLKNRNLHRRTLIANANSVDASPLRRRSIIQTPQTPVLENLNDDNERSNRRSLADIQRRLSNLPQAGSPLNESAKFIGEQEMKDHHQICTKLFAENKINTKNAWKLHIIDILRNIAQKTEKDILQMASTSLDISAKVYGIRVDDIHADGLKLASSMARAADKQPEHQDDDDGGDAEDGVEKENAAAKKKKKRRRLLAGEKNTIAKDPKSLLGPPPKLESVFFSTRTNSETSAIDNLFTNTLKMDNSQYKFMLLDKGKAWANEPDPAITYLKDNNKKQTYPLTLNPVTNLRFCIPFNDFHIDEWDPDEEEKQFALQSQTAQENEVIFDDNGIPIPELDGSIHDIFSNHDNEEDLMDVDDVIQEQQEFCGQIRNEIVHIVDFQPEEGMHMNEYSYNTTVSTLGGKVIDQIWAGPSHWKLKFIRRSSVRFSGQVTERNVVKQSKKKAKPEMLNFADDNYEKFDMNKKLKIKKKPATADIQKITLPLPDSSCMKMMRNVKELMSRPGVVPAKKKDTSATNDLEYEVSAYKYENPNDSQYCSQHGEAEDDHVGTPDDNFDNDNDNEEIVAQQNFLGDNLVDVPELVPNSYVPYALQAKRMDMKKLKSAVWQHLVQSDHAPPKDQQKREGEVLPTTFSKMYLEIPNLITAKMRQEISCPLAFVALLHLCNEQNLALKQHKGYKDFDILGPTSVE